MSLNIAVIGLPHAGKTAWLGRLWLAVEGKGSRLQLGATPRELGALRQVSDWLSDGRYPNRTAHDGPPRVTLDLQWEGRGKSSAFSLQVDDYNGEQLNSIYADRDPHWTEDWQRRAEADGLALFIRPDHIVPASTNRRVSRPHDADRDDAARLLGEGLMPEEEPAHRPVGPPTGLTLVEIIQLIRDARGLSMGEHPQGLRVAVIFTAWDAWPDASRGPDAVLRERLGLLDDLLATSFAADQVRCFGLSTTGGDLNRPAFRAEYQEGYPDEFGWVVWNEPDSPRRSEDITLPLGWLIEGDRALEPA